MSRFRSLDEMSPGVRWLHEEMIAVARAGGNPVSFVVGFEVGVAFAHADPDRARIVVDELRRTMDEAMGTPPEERRRIDEETDRNVAALRADR